jgi:hypothetical protein
MFKKNPYIIYNKIMHRKGVNSHTRTGNWAVKGAFGMQWCEKENKLSF